MRGTFFREFDLRKVVGTGCLLLFVVVSLVNFFRSSVSIVFVPGLEIPRLYLTRVGSLARLFLGLGDSEQRVN